MKAIIKRMHERETFSTSHGQCDQCMKQVCVIPGQGCMLCAIYDGRRGFINLTSPYRYFKTCNDVKYPLTEKGTGEHKELTGCLDHWNRKQSADELKLGE